MDQDHPADAFVQSAFAAPVQADEYLLPGAVPAGALVKADNVKLVVEALKDGKLRVTCGAWEDARVVLTGEMLALRREGTFWVISKIETGKLLAANRGFTMSHLQAEIRQAAHDIRTRFDQVETVAKDELHSMVEHLRGLVAKLPGEAGAVEEAVEDKAKLAAVDAADAKEFTAGEVQTLIDQIRGVHESTVAGLQNYIEGQLAAKAAEVEALEAKLAEALKPAPEYAPQGAAPQVAQPQDDPALPVVTSTERLPAGTLMGEIVTPPFATATVAPDAAAPPATAGSVGTPAQTATAPGTPEQFAPQPVTQAPVVTQTTEPPTATTHAPTPT